MSTAASKKIYNTKKWAATRAKVIEAEPVCHWCKRRRSTDADHVHPLGAGGDPYDLDNLVGSCKPCNSKRAATLQAATRKRGLDAAGEAAAADEADKFLGRAAGRPRPEVFSHSQKPGTSRPDTPEGPRFTPEQIEAGTIPPRLETRSHGMASYGVLVADWARRHLKNTDGNPLELYPWQLRVLSGLLEHQAGQFHHRWGLVSTARQQGKTTGLLIPLIGWWLTDGRTIRGGSQSVMSLSHKLQQAEDLTRGLFPILEEQFGFQTWSTYGRKEAVGPDGTIWRITASNTSAGHGTSNDLVIADEIWNVDDQVIEGGLLPTQRARPNPLALFVSTAGDDSSKFFQRWRERGITQIATGQAGRLYFAEWSVPPDASIDDRSWWPAANPALGISPLDWQALEDDAANLARDEFVRTSLNRWVASVASWLPVGAWDQLATKLRPASGGVLAVDSATDAADYAAVRAVRQADGVVQVSVGFNVSGTDRMWAELDRLITAEPDLEVLITPGLHAVAPADIRRRLRMWGQKEIGIFTEVVRNMILEGRIQHGGDALLDEHVRRAVAGRNGATITLSSVKSPGPIHLCRCMVAAAGVAARPTSAVRKPMIGTGRR